MNEKQTAVEWLVDFFESGATSREEWLIAKDKAKVMESEQKEYFFNCGRQYQLTGEGTFTEIYNETYGGDK